MNKSYIVWLLPILVIILLIITLWKPGQQAEAPTTPANMPAAEESPMEPTSNEEVVTPEETAPAASGDYIGLAEAEATALAEANGVPFRVVERDGMMLPTTRDYRPGRINATVAEGVVVSYTTEGLEMDKGGTEPVPVDNPGTVGEHDEIIGMTETEAKAYADAQSVPFRIGSIDGEVLPVTMDYRPGRITATLAGGVVTSYTVE
jgi:hypothetical protein